MIDQIENSLWFDGSGIRFFILSGDKKLPAGEFKIFSFLAEAQSVDENEIKAYEVAEDKVAEHINEKLDVFFTRLFQKLTEILDLHSTASTEKSVGPNNAESSETDP